MDATFFIAVKSKASKFNKVVLELFSALKEKKQLVTIDTLGWLGFMFLHAATIPSILGLIFGISDNVPSLDIVLLLWTGLFLFFVKALINKETVNIITHGVGFFIQALLLGLVVFK